MSSWYLLGGAVVVAMFLGKRRPRSGGLGGIIIVGPRTREPFPWLMALLVGGGLLWALSAYNSDDRRPASYVAPHTNQNSAPPNVWSEYKRRS